MNTLKIARFEFSMFGINTYAVWDPISKECAIIDPGMINGRERNALTEFVKKNELKVVHLVNTHLHIDHSIGNAFVEEEYGVPTEASPLDAFLGSGIKNQAEMFGLPFECDNVTIRRELKEGDVIKIGEGELKVLHVPGHSPGSLVFYDEHDGFLIAGDVLFQRSIGRTDLPGGDHNALLEGIRGKLLTLPPSTVVYPGHGPATTIGDELKSNPFF